MPHVLKSAASVVHDSHVSHSRTPLQLHIQLHIQDRLPAFTNKRKPFTSGRYYLPERLAWRRLPAAYPEVCQLRSASSGPLGNPSTGLLAKYNSDFRLRKSKQAHWPYRAMAASDGPPEGYRSNVGICLVNQNNKIFVATRLDMPGAWQMPQGGIDEGEDPRAAAVRELREETGVTSAEIIGESPEWLCYDFPPDVRERITRLWGNPWRGQAQKWFLLRFTGDDTEINLEGDGTEKPEFSEWMWVSPEEVVTKAVDFKKPVYEKAFQAFAPLLAGKVPM